MSARRRGSSPLFGVAPDRRASLRWALGSALGALACVAAIAVWRWIGPPEAIAFGAELTIVVGILGTAALFFGSTAVLLFLPERRRDAAQLWLGLAVALLFLGIVALPGEALYSPFALTGDEWPLAIPLALASLALGRFFLHPRYPLRGFVLSASLAFVLILPDFVGLLVEFTGGSSTLMAGSRGIVAPTPDSRWLHLGAEAAAARRASGVFLTWYLLLLAAAWAPLGWLLLRRRQMTKPA